MTEPVDPHDSVSVRIRRTILEEAHVLVLVPVTDAVVTDDHLDGAKIFAAAVQIGHDDAHVWRREGSPTVEIHPLQTPPPHLAARPALTPPAAMQTARGSPRPPGGSLPSSSRSAMSRGLAIGTARGLMIGNAARARDRAMGSLVCRDASGCGIAHQAMPCGTAISATGMSRLQNCATGHAVPDRYWRQLAPIRGLVDGIAWMAVPLDRREFPFSSHVEVR